MNNQCFGSFGAFGGSSILIPHRAHTLLESVLLHQDERGKAGDTKGVTHKRQIKPQGKHAYHPKEHLVRT